MFTVEKFSPFVLTAKILHTKICTDRQSVGLAGATSTGGENWTRWNLSSKKRTWKFPNLQYFFSLILCCIVFSMYSLHVYTYAKALWSRGDTVPNTQLISLKKDCLVTELCCLWSLYNSCWEMYTSYFVVIGLQLISSVNMKHIFTALLYVVLHSNFTATGSAAITVF